MDPNHRDRIAFVRLCSGKLSRGMKLKQVRTGKTITLHAPQFFFARDRELAEEAFAGDVVGIPNHGTLRIGDTLTEGEDINFAGVPNFAPEILRRVRLDDAMKAKKLQQALQQLAEEGVAQVFRPTDGSPALGRRGRPAAARRAPRAARRRIRARGRLDHGRSFSSRAGLRPRTARRSRSSPRATVPPSPRISITIWYFWRAALSTSNTPAVTIPALCLQT